MTLPLYCFKKKQALSVLFMNGCSIYEQLQIEEALLRTSQDNWCLINLGCSIPSIVMGLSAKPADVIDPHLYKTHPHHVTLIRRFSGGGTVYVDNDTFFFTLILSNMSSAMTWKNPKELMKWTHALIQPAFSPFILHLEENDFAINNMKVGGNAQSFTKERVLHHTSFLWSWKPCNMNLLLYPKKVPEYRSGRDHTLFCGMLQDKFLSMKFLAEKFLEVIEHEFAITHIMHDIPPLIAQHLNIPHRRSLEYVFL